VFSDLENHWGQENIVRLYTLGGIDGYPDGSFRPEGKVTKAEFLALTVKAVINNPIELSQKEEHWGSPYFRWAYKNNVIDLSDLDESTWDAPIIRYDMAKIIVSTLENVLSEAPVTTEGIEQLISDIDLVNASDRAEAVKQAFAKGILTGKNEAGLFAGEETGTRAEAATLILRMLDPTIRKTVSLAPQSIDDYVTSTDALTEEFIELFTQGVIKETNYQRAMLGIHSLNKDDLLTEIAQFKSDDMVALANAGESQTVYFSHSSPTYGTLRDLVTLFNLDSQKSVGENLAWMPYQPTDEQPGVLGKQAVLQLKNSSSHYAAMINEGYNNIGVGVSYRYYEAYNSGYLFVTQTFSN